MDTNELARQLLEEQKALVALAALLDSLGDRLMGEWTVDAVEAVRGAGVLAARISDGVGWVYTAMMPPV